MHIAQKFSFSFVIHIFTRRNDSLRNSLSIIAMKQLKICKTKAIGMSFAEIENVKFIYYYKSSFAVKYCATMAAIISLLLGVCWFNSRHRM